MFANSQGSGIKSNTLHILIIVTMTVFFSPADLNGYIQNRFVGLNLYD